MNKLSAILDMDYLKESDVTQMQAIAFEQLNSLAEKFSKLSQEETTDYEEMKLNITNIIEEYCTPKIFHDVVH